MKFYEVFHLRGIKNEILQYLSLEFFQVLLISRNVLIRNADQVICSHLGFLQYGKILKNWAR